MWTAFWDMHSGGDCKLQWEKIYIEAPEREAKSIFHNRFERDPDNVTFNCCGEDYSTYEYDSLELATEYHRKDGKGRSLEEYLTDPSVCVIRAEEIK